MIRIGIIDPETSHADAFTSILNSFPNVQVVGAATRHSANELFNRVNAVLILTRDWITHVDTAIKALEQDKFVFVDKPLCGSLRDLERIESHPKHSMVFAGSSLPCESGFQEFLSQHRTDNIQIAGPRNDFYMGIHSAELAASIDQINDQTSVEATEDQLFIQNEASQIELSHSDDWIISASGDRFVPNPKVAYNDMLKLFIDSVQENKSKKPLSMSANAVRIELAAILSRRTKQPVGISDVDPEISILE